MPHPCHWKPSFFVPGGNQLQQLDVLFSKNDVRSDKTISGEKTHIGACCLNSTMFPMSDVLSEVPRVNDGLMWIVHSRDCGFEKKKRQWLRFMWSSPGFCVGGRISIFDSLMISIILFFNFDLRSLLLVVLLMLTTLSQIFWQIGLKNDVNYLQTKIRLII